MNLKAQGYLAGLLGFGVFIIVWVAGLGTFIGETGRWLAIGQTGLLAFFLSYLNLWVFIGCCLGLLLYTGATS
jgi:hypothetical protein